MKARWRRSIEQVASHGAVSGWVPWAVWAAGTGSGTGLNQVLRSAFCGSVGWANIYL